MDDKISVIIPAYNIEKYLGRTLDSVLAQTHTNLEIIVVNDGSKDGTAALINSYAKKDSRIIAVHKENGGVSSARLRGLQESTGAWIAFVDGDDFVEPWMYERLLKNAEQYGAVISHCGYQMVLPSGKVRQYYGTGKLTIQDNHTGVKDLLDNRFIEPSLGNKLYARQVVELFLSSVHFDTSVRNTEDLLMNYYLFREANRSVYEDTCPYHYILRPGSAANAAVNKHQLQDPLKVKKILFQETLNDPECHALVANQLVRQLVSLSTLNVRNSPEVTRPARASARKELRRMLPDILKGSCYTKKFKLMGLWTAVWPGSYAMVHRLYERITGLDKIYEK